MHLRLPEIAHPVERLAVEVGFLHPVMIDDDQLANACCSQIGQHRAAEATRTHDQHRGGGEPCLTIRAHLREDCLAHIPIAHALSLRPAPASSPALSAMAS